MLTLERVKEYLRVDHDDEDTLIQAMMLAAKQYLFNAGIEEKDNELYRIVVMLLVSHFYVNRAVFESGRQSVAMIPYTLQFMITQLQYSDRSDKDATG